MSDLEKQMLNALKKVDPVVKMLLAEIRNEASADWGVVNDSLVEISKAVRAGEGK